MVVPWRGSCAHGDAMTVPALKAAAYMGELRDPSRMLSEFRLEQIMRDCEKSLKVTRSAEIAFGLHLAAGMAAGFLDRDERAAEHFRVAATLQPASHITLNNLSLALNKQARFAEALKASEDGLARAGGATYARLHANAARALEGLGRHAEAGAAFAHAWSLADLSDPIDLFMLSSCAAEVHDQVQAMVLFAAFLSRRFANGAPVVDPARFVVEAPAEWWNGLNVPTILKAELERGINDAVARALAAAPDDDEPLDDEELRALDASVGDRIEPPFDREKYASR